LNAARRVVERCPGRAKSSFGRRRLRVTGGCLLFPFSEHPGLQSVQIDIDNRRRIEREYLRQSKATDDGVTERLANLRTNPVAYIIGTPPSSAAIVVIRIGRKRRMQA